MDGISVDRGSLEWEKRVWGWDVCITSERRNKMRLLLRKRFNPKNKCLNPILLVISGMIV